MRVRSRCKTSNVLCVCAAVRRGNVERSATRMFFVPYTWNGQCPVRCRPFSLLLIYGGDRYLEIGVNNPSLVPRKHRAGAAGVYARIQDALVSTPCHEVSRYSRHEVLILFLTNSVVKCPGMRRSKSLVARSNRRDAATYRAGPPPSPPQGRGAVAARRRPSMERCRRP